MFYEIYAVGLWSENQLEIKSLADSVFNVAAVKCFGLFHDSYWFRMRLYVHKRKGQQNKVALVKEKLCQT